MAKDQDCFKIGKALKNTATKFAEDKSMSRSTVYRLALIEFLTKHGYLKGISG